MTLWKIIRLVEQAMAVDLYSERVSMIELKLRKCSKIMLLDSCRYANYIILGAAYIYVGSLNFKRMADNITIICERKVFLVTEKWKKSRYQSIKFIV
jgi:hypothetical protein